jgi:parvulin-like peptidyl-prolyl isomerase
MASALLLGVAINSPVHAQTVVDKVVASVDGDPITTRDVQIFTSQSGGAVAVQDMADSPAAKEALNQLIENKLLEKEGSAYAARVEDSQVDKYIEEFKKDHGLSDAQLRDGLRQNNISYDEFRQRKRQELETASMIQQQVREKIPISEADIKTYYDAHIADFTIKKERLKLAQILIAFPPNATPAQIDAARKKAGDVHALAVKGTDFNDLAHKYSDDDSKARGGALGWFDPSEVMDQILVAVKNLKPGDISGLIQTDHGFHVVKLEEHQVPGPRPMAEVKEQIRVAIENRESATRMKQWLDTEVVKKHYVEESLDTGLVH